MFKQNFDTHIHVVPLGDLTGASQSEPFRCPFRESDWGQVVTGRRESYPRAKLWMEVGADQALVAKIPSWRDESCRGWAVITRGPCRVEKLDYGSVERWSVVWCSPRIIRLERHSSGAQDHDIQIIGQCILLKSTRSVAGPTVEKYVTDHDTLKEFYRLIPRVWCPPGGQGANPRYSTDCRCRLAEICNAIADGVDPAPYSEMWDKSWPGSAKVETCSLCGKGN